MQNRDRVLHWVTAMFLVMLTTDSGLAQTTQPAGGGPRRREAKAYYVSPNGNDQNAGTPEQPFRTIQRGTDAAEAGDTVNIAGGTYRERVALKKSGRYFGRIIKTQAMPGEKVILDAAGLNDATGGYSAIFDTNGQEYLHISGITVQNGGFCGISVSGSWQVVLENCHTINTPGSGIMVDKSGMVQVRNCEVERACGNDGSGRPGEGSGEESISIKRSQDVVVEGCHIHHTGHEGIDVKEGAKHVRIRNNHIHHTQAQGLYAEAWDSPTYDIRFENNIVHNSLFGMAACAESGGVLSDVWYVNNIVYNNTGPGMIIADWGGRNFKHHLSGIHFINNTIVNNGGGGRAGNWGGGMVFENADTDNIVVMNNILSQNGQGQLRIVANKKPRSWRVENNLIDGESEDIGENNVKGKPNFANREGGDFKLQPGSPGIDAGQAVDGLPEKDFAGASRVQGKAIDIGAFEQ